MYPIFEAGQKVFTNSGNDWEALDREIRVCVESEEQYSLILIFDWVFKNTLHCGNNI